VKSKEDGEAEDREVAGSIPACGIKGLELFLSLFRKSSNQFSDLLEIVFRGRNIPLLISALHAAMGDDVTVFLHSDVDGFHHSAALGRPVAGIDIDVLAPEAAGTVIGVATAFHLCFAVATCEILFRADERLGWLARHTLYLVNSIIYNALADGAGEGITIKKPGIGLSICSGMAEK
jgi:hypothetical protein